MLGIDTRRIVLAGHSMGGWVVAHTAAQDHAIIGAILISAADMGREGSDPPKRLLASMADDLESLNGVTAESMAAELRTNAQTFRMENAVEGLTQIPLLALTADDGLASDSTALVSAIAAKGGHQASVKHFATDHSFSDNRIALESEIINWLAALVKQNPH
jgi:pimeloyl-ACP methyl ester carboxylesterase